MTDPAVAVLYAGVGRGAGGNAVVPGFVRKHEAFWDKVVLPEHPLRAELISCWSLEHAISSNGGPRMFFGKRCCFCGEHL